VLAEALRNATKHGHPSVVNVRVRRADGAFVLEVVNDGADGAQSESGGGMGLRLAALEALQHGGVLEFGAPDHGSWRIRLMVPMEVA
jgi:signal transduction histidine kinase